MIKEAFEYLFSRGESAGKAAIHEIGAEHYVSADHKLQAVRPPRPYLASAREIHTLDGLAAYLEHCPADLEIDSTAILDRVPLIHIVSPTCVHLTTLLFDNRRERECLLNVSAHLPSPFPFGKLMDQELFVIQAQVSFAEGDDRELMLRTVGTLKATRSTVSIDDGVTQTVTASTGTALANTDLPNPVILRPWRTFSEIEQPSASYVLRASGGSDDEPPKVALFEVGDQRWKLEAIASIRSYLEGLIKDVPIIA